MKQVTVRGVVQQGRRLGRTIGFPTVNVALPNDVAVADGVYRSQVQVGEASYPAMSNVGCNPSVGGNERRVESHLLGFEGDLYDREIEVTLLERLRDERHFSDLEELKAQLECDKQQILDTIDKQ